MDKRKRGGEVEGNSSNEGKEGKKEKMMINEKLKGERRK